MDRRPGGDATTGEAESRCGDARTRWPRPVYRPVPVARADCLRQRDRSGAAGLSGRGLPFSLFLHLAVLILLLHVPGLPSRMASLEVFVAGPGTEPSPKVTTPLEVPRRIEPADPSAVDAPVNAMTEAERDLPSFSAPSPSQAGVHIVVEPKSGPPQDEPRRPQRSAPTRRSGPRAVAASAKPDAGTSASSAASRPERGTLPKADVPEPTAPDADVARGKPGPAEPVVTARATPPTPPGTGGDESPTLRTDPTPGEPVALGSPLPGPTALRPEPALPAVVEPTPAPSVHDRGTTAERPVESIASQLVAAETAVPQDEPRPAEREPVITARATPTMAPGIEAQALPAPSKAPAPAELAVASRIRSEPEPGSAGAPEAPDRPGRSERQTVATTRLRRKTPSESSALPAPATSRPVLDAPREVDVPPPAPSLPERETTAERPVSSQPDQVLPITGLSSDPVVRIAEAPPASGGPGRVDPVARPATKPIVITSPANGLRLGPDEPPIVVVEGEVEDATLSRVWLVANDRRIAVPVQSGRFRQALVIPDSTLHIHAEVDTDGATAHRTAPVAVHSTSSGEFGIVMIEWPRGSAGLQIDLTGRWRSSPDRLDGPVRTFPLRAVTSLNEGSTRAFYFRRPKPGAYSFVLHHRGSGVAGELIPTLYLPRDGQLARVVPKPMATGNAGLLLLGRVLLPWGVLWEQDDWFTGRVEGVDTITKFRMPEGVTWTEGRSGPR